MRYFWHVEQETGKNVTADATGFLAGLAVRRPTVTPARARPDPPVFRKQSPTPLPGRAARPGPAELTRSPGAVRPGPRPRLAGA